MTWRSKLLRILSWPALAAGGMTTAAFGANAAEVRSQGLAAPTGSDHASLLLPNTLNATADDRYAAHGSHRSHSSHRSHRSSSGGGSRSVPSSPTPQPQYDPQSPSPAPRTTPEVAPQTEQSLPKPTPQDLSMMVVRVQAALMRRGYYQGDIDGLLGPMTRAALRAFQQAEGISPNRAHGHRHAYTARYFDTLKHQWTAARGEVLDLLEILVRVHPR